MFGIKTGGRPAIIPIGALMSAMLLSWPGTCRAGGGPENVLLVVNPESADSMAIANYYQQWRAIPPGNILYLPWKPDQADLTVDDFRDRILKPILGTIGSRRLTGQIDYIVYSCDFPWRVNTDADFKEFRKESWFIEAGKSPPQDAEGTIKPDAYKAQMLDPRTVGGSLTGMTYLEPLTREAQSDYLALLSNYYFRAPQGKEPSSLGFRSSRQFGPDGQVVRENGRRYRLSVMLGVTFGRGNTREEILHYLQRSASADGTLPRGTIYFMRNGDIRSSVRQAWFPAAVEGLKKLGVRAEIVGGTMPLERPDVQGVMMGSADIAWKSSKSVLLPGSIADNLTSYGGIFMSSTGQTPLTDFLRYGASGSSGTVTEPFVLQDLRYQAKFPMPDVFVHYARGCTLAEAYYQAVASPYQLLIVGDPLCRPWAKIPQVKVGGVAPGAKVKGTINLRPEAVYPGGEQADHFELFVGGSRAMRCKPGETLSLDTRLLPDGWNELRVVAVGSGPIETQGRTILGVQTENYGRKIDVKTLSQGPVAPGRPLTLEVASPGSIGVVIIQNSRLVGRVSGEQGKIVIPASALGTGPVRLQAIGLGRKGAKSHVLAAPIDVEVDLPAPLKPGEKP
jgi:uncharacterized protein (TIGR03790 family)